MLNKKGENNMTSELNDVMTKEGDRLIDFEIRTKDKAKYKKACNMIKNYVANFVLTKAYDEDKMIDSMCFMNDSQTACLGFSGNTVDLSDLYRSIESLGDFYMKGCAVNNPNYTYTEDDLPIE
tara:strand:+ start:102 stop:470 length:369 start_codon:yes stop_codon:yes gene_type:complete